MKSIFTLALLCWVLPASAQVSESYCAWEDANNAYHIARVNAASGSVTSINTVSGNGELGGNQPPLRVWSEWSGIALTSLPQDLLPAPALL